MRFLIVILALLTNLSPAHADALGRLFFTPEERSMLDRERQKSGLPGILPGLAEPPPTTVTLNGHIVRSSGRSTFWFNGRPQYAGDTPQTSEVSEKISVPGEIVVRLPESNRPHSLKVGQTLTPASGEIREGYQKKTDSGRRAEE